MVVEDALEDVRFAGNPLVTGSPGIRFYAGAPLVSSANGYRYGSLCIIDTKPHKEFTSDQYNLLAQFAELTVREIEKDKLNLLQKMVQEQRGALGLSPSASASPTGSLRSSVELEPANWGLSRAANCFVEGVMLVDVATTTWQILYTNPAFSNVLGVPKDEATSQGFWDMFGGLGIDADACAASVEANEPFSITVALQSIYRQTPKSVTIDFRPTTTTQLGVVGVPVGTGSGEVQTSSENIRGSTDFNNDVTTNDASVGRPSQSRHLFFAIVQPEQLRPGAVRPVSDGARRVGIIQAPRTSQPSQRSSSGSGTSGGTSAPSTVLSINKAMPTAFTDVRLGPLIGRGAYGRVYRGSWNGNTVAVKVMETTENIANPGESPPSSEIAKEEEEGGARGLFEAVLSSSLSHPNVVHTYQYAVRPISKPVPGTKVLGENARRASLDASAGTKRFSEVWLISEFCNRGPLLTAVERGAFLTQPSAQYGQPNLIAVLQTLQEIAAAMHYLHAQGIVHGDLTGGNVLLTSSDKDARGFSAKVVDFGLSRVCGESGYLQTNTMGCAEYMPPELITGGILTKAGDVYAFGIITWELYVGRRAWEGLQPGQVLKKVASNEMLKFPGQTPHRLKILGERCMLSDPKLRPTFDEVLSEVNAILTDTMSILQQFLHATSSNGRGTIATKE